MVTGRFGVFAWHQSASANLRMARTCSLRCIFPFEERIQWQRHAIM
jgi:hypothetical protein